MCEHNKGAKMNRRSVLKSTGAFAGMNLTGFSPSELLESRLRLVKAAIEFEPIGEVNRSHLPVVHFDFPPDYRINSNEDALVTNPYAERHAEIVRYAKDHDLLIDSDEYVGGSDGIFGGENRKPSLIVEPDFRGTYLLDLSDPVSEPNVRISDTPEGVGVAVEGKRERLTAGEQSEIRLSNVSVELTLTNTLDERVDDADVAEHRRPLKTVQEQEIVQFGRTLRVKNFGELDLYKGKKP